MKQTSGAGDQSQPAPEASPQGLDTGQQAGPLFLTDEKGSPPALVFCRLSKLNQVYNFFCAFETKKGR